MHCIRIYNKHKQCIKLGVHKNYNKLLAMREHNILLDLLQNMQIYIKYIMT